MSESGAYRPEIDGLRALAVAGVLLCHLKVPGFAGGFVGVDVFFVISGYLITGMIVRDVEHSEFSLSSFYIRRTRRLFPALLATLIASFAAAVFLFSPERLQAFAVSLIAATLSGSNFLFWSQHGYFDAASNLKPLLHTWSLGVEEQFYLLWPVILVFLSRRKLVTAGLAILLVGSLGANFWFWDNTSAIFFLLPFRVFEFAIGGLLTRYESRMSGRQLWNGATALGLVFIIASYAIYDDTSRFPALLPCLGASLIILGGRASAGANLLRNPVAIFIGRRSYSLYLVHWPIIVFFGYATDAPIKWQTRALLGAASIISAGLLYRYVEQPLRLSDKGKPPLLAKGFFPLSAVLVLLLLLAGATSMSEGWVWRLGSRSDLYRLFLEHDGRPKHFVVYGGADCVTSPCDTNPGKPPTYYVIGDSHARQYFAGFKVIFPTVNVRFFHFSSCPFFSPEFARDFSDYPDPKLYDQGCRSQRRAAFAEISESGDATVIVSQFWVNFPLLSEATGAKHTPADLPAAARFAASELARLKKVLRLNRLFVVGTVPGMPGFGSSLDCLARPISFADDCNFPSRTKEPQLGRASWNESLKSPLGEVAVFLDPFAQLCDEKTCKTVQDGMPVYSDQDHLTKWGAELLIRSFADSIGGGSER